MHKQPSPYYYGAIINHLSSEIDIFICRVLINGDNEVAIDFKRIDKNPDLSLPHIPEHNNLLTSKEELNAIGATSVSNQKINCSIETYIAQFFMDAFPGTSVEVKKIRQNKLDALF